MDEANPAKLGELVRALLQDWPELEVHHDARRLPGAPKGGLVILAPDAAQAGWLNLERPVVTHRDLRLVLFCDAATSAELARRAVDFFHWISHRISCPPGPPPAAVRTIQAALRARARGIAWGGGDLKGAFAKALPGRELRLVSAAQPYEELVEAARPVGRSWVGFTDADGPFRLRRVRWAMAEAGRRGRAALVEAKGSLPGFWPAHGRLTPIGDAIEALEAAGAKQAGRLAALLELEPEAIEITATLLRSGAESVEVELVAAQAQDPGSVLAGKTEESEKAQWRIPPAYRARAQGEGTVRRTSLLEALLRRARREPAEWGVMITAALRAGDAAVAELWARQWLSEAPEQPDAVYFWGAAALAEGRILEATVALSQATTRLEQQGAATRILRAAYHDLGLALYLQCKHEEAERAVRQSLRLAQGRAEPNLASSVRSQILLGDVLLAQGRYPEAQHLLERVERIRTSFEGREREAPSSVISGIAHVFNAHGRHAEAERLLRIVLAHRREPGPSRLIHDVRCLYELGRALNGLQRYAEAEIFLKAASKSSAAQWGAISAVLLSALGESLSAQGKYADAEKVLRRALAQSHAQARLQGRGKTLYELGLTLVAQGRAAEAESVLREAVNATSRSRGNEYVNFLGSLDLLAGIAFDEGRVSEAEMRLRELLLAKEQWFGRDDPSLAPTLHELAQAIADDGRPSESEPLLRRALRLVREGGDAQLAALVMSTLASSLDQMRRDEAVDTARRARAALIAAFGENESTIQEHLERLDTILSGATRRR